MLPDAFACQLSFEIHMHTISSILICIAWPLEAGVCVDLKAGLTCGNVVSTSRSTLYKIL